MPKTSFRPQTHGFAFVNSWTLDETESDQIRRILASAINAALMTVSPVLFAPLVVLGLGRRLGDAIAGGLPQTYGLCGGMAFAALDYYRTGLPLPRGTGPSDWPTRKTPKGATLRSYLWQRLLESLTIGRVAANMLACMAALHMMPKLPAAGSWISRQRVSGSRSEQPLDQRQHPLSPRHAVGEPGLAGKLVATLQVPLEVADQGRPVGVLGPEPQHAFCLLDGDHRLFADRLVDPGVDR